MSDKRYYWLKLKDTFMTSDTIDYFMSQPDGANYVVLYQMLCLKTINTEGRLSRQIGEVIIPYDIEKIRRDCKWFSADTIRVALQLYQSFGLIYEDSDGTLVLTDHENLVGSATTDDHTRKLGAERQARYRLAQKNANSVTVTPQITDGVTSFRNGEIRDKDIRDEDLKENTPNGVSKKDDAADAAAPAEAKHSYGEYGWVKLTDKQYEKLTNDLGEAELNRCIRYIDESAQITKNKNKWSDWNAVLRKCHREGWGANRNGGRTVNGTGRTRTSAEEADARWHLNYDAG